jgi:hypothetical protein
MNIREIRIRDSAVGVESDYGLDNLGLGVRFPVVQKIFWSQRSQDRLRGPPNLLSSIYWLQRLNG